MSTDGFDELPELQRSLAALPENVQKRIARAWARKWSRAAYNAAVSETPRGRTRNLLAGIKRRDSKRGTLQRLNSFARSVVIGAKPANHFHLVNLGTKPRMGKHKSGTAAFRGAMPRNDFVARAALPLMAEAESDLRVLVRRNLARLLKKEGGGS